MFFLSYFVLLFALCSIDVLFFFLLSSFKYRITDTCDLNFSPSGEYQYLSIRPPTLLSTSSIFQPSGNSVPSSNFVGVLGANDFDRFVLSDSFFIDTISLSGIFLDVSVLDLDMFPDDDLVGVVFVSMDFSFSLVVVVLFFFDSISLVGVFVACFADSTFLFGVELGIVFFEYVSLNGIFESVSLGLFFGSLTDVFLGVVFFDSDVLSDFSLGDVSLEVVFLVRVFFLIPSL